MYVELSSIINDLKKVSTMILIAGDFNAKVGKRNANIPCLGKFSRGRRNKSGESFIDFCNNHSFYITNSSFQHRACHITTWESKITKNNKIITVYNQIDYILMKTLHGKR